jgi:dimethylhistidine N-methyltransferase
MRFRLVDRLVRDPGAERSALVASLRARPAAIAPKYFYDELGSALYGAICELPEYYPTRTERAIFVRHRDEIAKAVGTGVQFVDLGAGDGAKAEGWLPRIAAKRYIAVDIASHALQRTLERLAPRFPDVAMTGVVSDFAAGLDLEADLAADPVAFFYPGSSIGNFTPEDSVELLRGIFAYCSRRPRSGLLIGVDTKKDRRRLEAAYDDALGVTAAFNRNVLNHVERLLSAGFDANAFRHVAFYSEERGRIEMHLEAVREQPVTIDGARRVFAEGERIHTENSYKYAPDEFEALLALAGFASVRRWQDDAKDFAVFYAA